MNFKKPLVEFVLRVLRFIGALALIYVCMVFYLALTERQNAYPRAITHQEAEAAIQSTAKPVSCTLEDGTVLGGWTLYVPEDTTRNVSTASDSTISDSTHSVPAKISNASTLLYFPDADEDAAQFLAEVQDIENVTLITFNYRGSANNKGNPSSETFTADAYQIAECAAQVDGHKPQFLAGRGVGAILAGTVWNAGQHLILIDPVASIADAISDKYRALYPKFLVRAKEALPVSKITGQPGVSILYDRVQFRERADKVAEMLTPADKNEKMSGPLDKITKMSSPLDKVSRGEGTFKGILQSIITAGSAR